MSGAVTLRSYAGEADAAAERIAAFRLAHSDYVQTREDALGDLRAWTSDGHRFYFLDAEGAAAGFAHLGSRDGEIDWVEELFIRPEYQGHGLGAAALEADRPGSCAATRNRCISKSRRGISARSGSTAGPGLTA